MAHTSCIIMQSLSLIFSSNDSTFLRVNRWWIKYMRSHHPFERFDCILASGFSTAQSCLLWGFAEVTSVEGIISSHVSVSLCLANKVKINYFLNNMQKATTKINEHAMQLAIFCRLEISFICASSRFLNFHLFLNSLNFGLSNCDFN